MKEHILAATEILRAVFTEGAYPERLINSSTSDMTARLVYGTLEKHFKIEKILIPFLEKRPKPVVYCILRVGVYCLLHIDNVPDYAVVNECVEVAKGFNKGMYTGLVNAVLKKVSRREYVLPKEGEEGYLSVKYNKPAWFIARLQREYGHALATKP